MEIDNVTVDRDSVIVARVSTRHTHTLEEKARVLNEVVESLRELFPVNKIMVYDPEEIEFSFWKED